MPEKLFKKYKVIGTLRVDGEAIVEALDADDAIDQFKSMNPDDLDEIVDASAEIDFVQEPKQDGGWKDTEEKW